MRYFIGGVGSKLSLKMINMAADDKKSLCCFQSGGAAQCKGRLFSFARIMKLSTLLNALRSKSKATELY